eukprot:c2513_g1_i2.p1 GENE.c2513_g1_i2~~c2513_g1_i2.p1  ORF type:complete len:749 (-),score=219.71 c2513_g1_i2:226-2472(-)
MGGPCMTKNCFLRIRQTHSNSHSLHQSSHSSHTSTPTNSTTTNSGLLHLDPNCLIMLVISSFMFLGALMVLGVRRHNAAWILLPVIVCGALLASVLLLELSFHRAAILDDASTFMPDKLDFIRAPLFSELTESIHMLLYLTGIATVLTVILSKLLFPRRNVDLHQFSNKPIPIFVTGISACLPSTANTSNPKASPFSREALDLVFEGQNLIQNLSSKEVDSMVSQNVAIVKKNKKDGSMSSQRIITPEESIKLAAQVNSDIDFTKFGIPASVVGTMDMASKLAVAAGLEALKDAGLIKGGDVANPENFRLPASLQDSTGIIFASSFPAIESTINEVSRKYIQDAKSRPTGELVSEIRNRLKATNGAAIDKAIPQSVIDAMTALEDFTQNDTTSASEEYEFDRKFLFRVLVHANAQLAQIVQAKGPNTHTNGACAGTSQAISIAQDMLRLNRAQRVVVIAGDNASSASMMPWIGSGFRALGAASIAQTPFDASRPFDVSRKGMVVGSGAVAIVLEREDAFIQRMTSRHFTLTSTSISSLEQLASPQSGTARPSPTLNAQTTTPSTASSNTRIQLSTHQIHHGNQYYCRVIDSHSVNSAFHGVAMDSHHMGAALDVFLTRVEQQHGISRHDIATHGIYLSHETMTNASPEAACATNEIQALRECFGEDMEKMVIVNTKAMTGHPMGVSFEDVVAAEALRSQRVPPVVNLECPEPILGNLRFSKGGHCEAKYALRFAAGFGSQVVFVLFGL